MKFWKYYIFILLGLIISCTNDVKENDKIIRNENNPLTVDSINFKDFMRQGKMLRNDSIQIGYAIVEEIVRDSIFINKTDSILKFGVRVRMVNGQRQYDMAFGLFPNKKKLFQTNPINFWQTLEAMKQIRAKMNYVPNNQMKLVFNEDKNKFQAEFDPKIGHWKSSLQFSNNVEDTTQHIIPLEISDIDSIIFKLNNIRAYFIKSL